MFKLKSLSLCTLSLLLTLTFFVCTACHEQPQEQGDVNNTHQDGHKNESSNSEQGSSNLYQDHSPVVARIGDVVITQKEIERRLNQLSPFTRARYQSPDRKREFLDSLIRFELLAYQAKQAGHHLKPDVVLSYKQSMVRELIQQDIRGLVKMGDISTEELKAYYKEHTSDYNRPEQYRASHILLADQKTAEVTLKEILIRTRTQPKKVRMIFGDFAMKRSLDLESKNKRGDLQYFTRDGQGVGERRIPQSVPPMSVIEAAFSLQNIGDILDHPVQSEKGWHLIQHTGKKREFSRSFEEVETEIRNIIFRSKKGEAMENYVKNLRAQATIKIDEELLLKIKVPAPNPKSSPPRLSPYTSMSPPFDMFSPQRKKSRARILSSPKQRTPQKTPLKKVLKKTPLKHPRHKTPKKTP